MSEKYDISGLTRITVNLDTTTTNNLGTRYNPYSLYIEDRIGEDVPKEYQTNLYDLYNAGIDNMVEDGWKVTIGEEISSYRQMWLTDNFNLINREFGEVDNVIEYDKINQLASTIDKSQSYTEISNAIFDFLQTGCGIDFSMNPNPENSDNSNLILTQKTRQKIQPIVESILNKVFRNLMQLIRVKHDYRLYGTNSTVFTGNSELSSANKMHAWSSLPSSCWQQYSGNYVVGVKAYNEPTGDVGSSSIKNTRTDISPYSVFGIKGHKHDVSIPDSALPRSQFSMTRQLVGEFSQIKDKGAAEIKERDKVILWSECVKRSPSAIYEDLECAGFGMLKDRSGSCITKGYWKYSWATNGNCKLVSKSSYLSNIFSKELSNLPTYSSYVWKWVGTDDTNITSPKKDISATLGNTHG